MSVPSRRLVVAARHAAPVADLLHGHGLQRTEIYDGWLNRVTIELLCRATASPAATRKHLVRTLLDFPVVIDAWDGARDDLAGLAPQVRPHALYAELLAPFQLAWVGASLQPRVCR